MRINRIENRKVNVDLTADELVMFGNIMYEHQKAKEEECKALFHEAYAQVMTARDLCQYGHVDAFTLRHIVLEKLKANPDGDLKKLGITLDKEEVER